MKGLTSCSSRQQGTNLPYLEWAQQNGYSFVILSPNETNGKNKKGALLPIVGSETPEKHAIYCWEHIVSVLPAKKIHIVAHSYGGMCTLAMLFKFSMVPHPHPSPLTRFLCDLLALLLSLPYY